MSANVEDVMAAGRFLINAEGGLEFGKDEGKKAGIF